MKAVRNLIFLLSLIPFSKLSAQCLGDFTWLANGTSYTFIGTTTPGVTNISWSFGDGNFDYSNNASTAHTYAAAGTYTACIMVYDSLNSCSDSACHTFTIDSCFGSFTYTTNGLTANFSGTANGGSPNTVWMWSFGDNSTGNTQNPVHTYANYGTYTVCFAYYDQFTGCSDSICMPITFTAPVCNADFTWIDSVGYIYFIGSSSLNNTGSYIWTFGDGNYGYQQNPSNSYQQIGTYQVCLTVYDSLQNFCDSTCHMVTVINLAGLNETRPIASAVLVSPNPSDDFANVSYQLNQTGEVNFIVYDLAGRIIEKEMQQVTSSGKQFKKMNTESFASGTYLIQINVNGQIVNTKLVVTHKQ